MEVPRAQQHLAPACHCCHHCCHQPPQGLMTRPQLQQHQPPLNPELCALLAKRQTAALHLNLDPGAAHHCCCWDLPLLLLLLLLLEVRMVPVQKLLVVVVPREYQLLLMLPPPDQLLLLHWQLPELYWQL